MKYNDGAEIVPAQVLSDLLEKIGPQSGNDVCRYDRWQLLTEAAARDFVFKFFDGSWLSYGSLSPDFPSCEDIARIFVGDMLKASYKAGFAVRPAILAVEYTRVVPPRHAIGGIVLSNRSAIYFDPQNGQWSKQPSSVKTIAWFRV